MTEAPRVRKGASAGKGEKFGDESCRSASSHLQCLLLSPNALNGSEWQADNVLNGCQSATKAGQSILSLLSASSFATVTSDCLLWRSSLGLWEQTSYDVRPPPTNGVESPATAIASSLFLSSSLHWEERRVQKSREFSRMATFWDCSRVPNGSRAQASGQWHSLATVVLASFPSRICLHTLSPFLCWHSNEMGQIMPVYLLTFTGLANGGVGWLWLTALCSGCCAPNRGNWLVWCWWQVTGIASAINAISLFLLASDACKWAMGSALPVHSADSRHRQSMRRRMNRDVAQYLHHRHRQPFFERKCSKRMTLYSMIVVLGAHLVLFPCPQQSASKLESLDSVCPNHVLITTCVLFYF